MACNLSGAERKWPTCGCYTLSNERPAVAISNQWKKVGLFKNDDLFGKKTKLDPTS